VKNIQQADRTIEYARLFDIRNTPKGTCISIQNPWQGAIDVQLDYLLYDRNKSRPICGEDTLLIPVPVKKVVCMSTTHVAFLSSLQSTECIKAVANSRFVFDSVAQRLIADGLIDDIGSDQNPDYERIVQIVPDIVLVYAVGGETLHYIQKLKGLGIQSMIIAEYLEPLPLGRAEWVRLFGELTEKREMADTLFSGIVQAYEQVKKEVSHLENKPSVMTSLPYEGVWYIPGGDAYFARLIKDAGGEYLWKDNTSNSSFPVSLEEVLSRTQKADVWVHCGSKKNKKEILAVDARIKYIPPYKKNRIYNNNKRVNDYGGNDFYESGVVKPHLILKDLASIFYFDVFMNHVSHYYQHIE
jgi:iron complex transport system substrate-binding protein